MKDEPVFPSQPMERVHEGMAVVDAAGKRLGTVGLFKMGDPEAVTVAGNDPSSAAVAGTGASLGSALGIASPEPRVPEPLRRDLLRVGFIKLDGADVPEDARYILADRVDHVSGDTVHLGPELTTARSASAAPPPRRARTTVAVAEPVTGGAAVLVAAPPWDEDAPPTRSRVMAAGIGVAGGSLLGAFGGALAWLFAQWQRSRNERPTRVRRQLQRLGKTTPRSLHRSESRPWLVPALGVGGMLASAGAYLFWRSRHEDGVGPWGSTGSTDTLERVAQEGGRLQLVEEELQAQKRDVGGEVRLSKEVVTEERSLDVPLTHEEIVVQRRAVDRQPTTEPMGTNQEIEVRATAEKVVGVEKDTIVTEEVRVGKRVEHETEQVTDTVRREVLRVEREGQGRAREESDVERERERPTDRP